MKRIAEFSVAFSIIVAIITSTAFATPGYNVGPITYELTDEYLIDMNDATTNNNIITFEENGQVTYDFYLIFNAASVDFTYTVSHPVVLTVDSGKDAPYTLNLSSTNGMDSTARLVFTNAETDDGNSEPKGERIFVLTASAPLEIKSIVFNKVKINTTVIDGGFFLCDISEDEEAIQTSVLVDQKSSILLVNGARRYIDIQNPRQICLTHNGRIYLPVHTLARALGYYYEDAPDKIYTLMRHDTFEFCFSPTESYNQNFGGEKISVSDVRIYKDGITYLPLRMFAEVLGKTVDYKDGIAVIDDKFSVADILQNHFEFVDNTFKPFRMYGAEERYYYVSQNDNASDNNDGSINAPFRTISRAAKVAKAGDTVIVHEGVYREILAPKYNGTPTAPIIFKAADGEKVVISANETISNFTEENDGIYTAPIAWNLGAGRNQIFYNDDSLSESLPLVEARHPNISSTNTTGIYTPISFSDEDEPFSPLWPIAGEFTVQTLENEEGLDSLKEGSNIVKSETLLNQNENDYWKGAYFVSMHGVGWSLHNARVESSTYGELTLTDMSQTYWPFAKDNDRWKYGYLSGHINALDAPGEWVIQNNTLYLKPPMEADTDDFSVEVKKRQLVADLSNCKYVQLKGFETIGGSIKMNNSEMCVLDGLKMSYLNHYIIGEDQHSGYIDDAVRTNPQGAPLRGEVGIYVGGRDNVIVNNQMSYAAASAIYGVGRNIYIENNTIKECGYAGSYVSGIFFSSEGWKDSATPRGGHSVYGNTVYRAGRSVIQFTRAAGHGLVPHLPSEIAFNDFHDGTLTSLDSGITYSYYVLLGHEKLFTNFHHNYVYYTMDQKNPYQFGIFNDGGTQNVNVYNNVVFTTNEDTWFTGSKPSGENREESIDKFSIFSADVYAAYAHCPKWNNAIIDTVSGGPDNLNEQQFPDEKTFYAGSGMNMQENRINCNDYFGN